MATTSLRASRSNIIKGLTKPIKELRRKAYGDKEYDHLFEQLESNVKILDYIVNDRMAEKLGYLLDSSTTLSNTEYPMDVLTNLLLAVYRVCTEEIREMTFNIVAYIVRRSNINHSLSGFKGKYTLKTPENIENQILEVLDIVFKEMVFPNEHVNEEEYPIERRALRVMKTMIATLIMNKIVINMEGLPYIKFDNTEFYLVKKK